MEQVCFCFIFTSTQKFFHQHSFKVNLHTTSYKKKKKKKRIMVFGLFKTLFDAGKFNVDIRVEQPNSLNMHIAGGCISGLCTITCTGPATIRGFTLTHAVRSDFLPVPAVPIKNPHAFPHICEDVRNKVKGSKPLFKQEFVLFGSRKGAEISVAPGTYTYPFQIQIPEWVPGGFSAGILTKFSTCCDCCCECCGTLYIMGGVIHSLDVQIIIANSFLDHDFDREIDVQQAAPNETLAVPRPIQSRLDGDTVGCCCCSADGHISLTLQLPRRDWVIGLDNAIYGRYSGSATVDFDLCLMSTTKFGSKMSGSFGQRHQLQHLTQTKLVRTSFKGGYKGTYDANSGGVEFVIPLPRDLPASYGTGGTAENLCSVAIEYSIAAVPRGVRCSDAFDEPSMPMTVNIHRALSAASATVAPMNPNNNNQMTAMPMQQQQQQYAYNPQHQQPLLPPPPPPQGYGNYQQANFAPSIPTGPMEMVYAYTAPPQSAVQQFHPAYQVTETNLPPAVWGMPVQVVEAGPNNNNNNNGNYYNYAAANGNNNNQFQQQQQQPGYNDPPQQPVYGTNNSNGQQQQQQGGCGNNSNKEQPALVGKSNYE